MAERDITQPSAYWNLTTDALLGALRASSDGLADAEAQRRLVRFGRNAIKAKERATWLSLLLNQFRSPLVLILVFAAVIAMIVGEWTDASIVLIVVFGSTLLGFAQEYRASSAVEKLRAQITIRSHVLRDGRDVLLPSEELVPGDVVTLSAGSLIPADGVVLSAHDFFVNQAVLTGETFPVEKHATPTPAKAGLAERTNCVFLGTSVGSGTARVLIVETGAATMFGQIAHRLSLRPAETEFEHGVRRFGNLLTRVISVMTIVVLAANVFLDKPLIDSLLFALALAVGLTPELLPAILSITLAHGAQRMAARGVIVRRLSAIANLGSMDVMCTDKTGTLTEGVVRLDGALDAQGRPSPDVLRAAYLNAHFQTGLDNPLDAAIDGYARERGVAVVERKIDEIPYDFVRKRLSIIVGEANDGRMLITKGALGHVVDVCDRVRWDGVDAPLDDAKRAAIERLFGDWSERGYRVLGVATKRVEGRAGNGTYSRADETGLAFAGFLLFFDPPKSDVPAVIADLAARGVRLKIITGDNQKVARHVAEAVNLSVEGLLTGTQIDDLRDEALWHLAERTTIFAEVDPNQKERIILALRKTGHVVGYMGDGINDAPALHSADVSVSVDNAVDVAKDAADFVLLRTDLSILREGIDEGRTTFANTLKYILTSISANFGNMFSMAGASVLLPFLPLLSSQILLNNFLADIPATTIAGDNVDAEWVAKPRRWNTAFIRDYMVLFGLVSSLFDVLTFVALLFVFRTGAEAFRTGWFIESLLTELVIALVVRTRHPFFRSRPSTLLLAATAVVVAVTLALPYAPFAEVFGFVPLPAPLLLAIIGITLLYVVAAELAKKYFFARAAHAEM